MNKILLVLTILGAGGGVFFTARQSTTRLQHEANATRGAWLAQTQVLTDAHSDQAGLIVRIRELKQALTQPQSVSENALWSGLQTNRAGPLTSELRERLLEELGFNWQSSEEFIVVSKEALREIGMRAIPKPIDNADGKLTDNAATVLAITPEERGQVEAAMQRVQTDFKDWALLHIERSEPKDDVVAQYTLPADPAMSQSLSNILATGLFAAVGRERAELILRYARVWVSDTTGFVEKTTTMIVKRYLVGNELRLNAQVTHLKPGVLQPLGDSVAHDISQRRFPRPFLAVFPNGWADVAQREGFELPKELQKK
jgi:hypothetical protein